MAQVLDSPTHSPIQSRKVVDCDAWRLRSFASSKTEENPLDFHEGDNSNSSFQRPGVTSQQSMLPMDHSSQQSHSQSQAMSEVLTQNADFTQMTQDGDNEAFSLSPVLPHSPVKLREQPWGRLMPCSGGKAIELLPRRPLSDDKKKQIKKKGPLVSLLGLENLHPSDQFNEFWLGRSQKCDVTAHKPESRVEKEQKLQEWGYGLISNRHCRIYCTLPEDARTVSASNMEVWVEDSSNNGTMINQTILLKRGQKRRLHSGDEVSLLNADTLRKKMREEAAFQPLLQRHSFVFVKVAHQQQQQQQQQKPKFSTQGMFFPPFSNPSTSARKRRGLVNPRAMHYPTNRGGARPQQKTPFPPGFAAAPHATCSFGAHPTPRSANSQSQRSRSCSNAISSHSPPARASSPRRIEQEYDIRDLLGRGTCGEVRRAIHRTSGRERAVKIVSLPSPGLMSHKQQEEAQQWQAEARILQTLEHPYIVQLIDVFCTESHLYLVMDLCTGGDLFDRIVQRGKYTEVNSRRVMRRLFSAVHYIHEDCEIVHRDLKPENILLSSSDIDVKITDFGVAKSASGGLKTLCGTPGYLAPEVLKRRHTVLGQGRYGKSADLYSLGVIMYVLLSGMPPFNVDGVQGMEIILQSGNQVQFPPEHWSSISEEAVDLVKRLLVMDPRKRISIRGACEHPWVLMDDSDTHQHPLEDPKLLAVTKKRLFPGSPLPTPLTTPQSPTAKRLKQQENLIQQTVAAKAKLAKEKKSLFDIAIEVEEQQRSSLSDVNTTVPSLEQPDRENDNRNEASSEKAAMSKAPKTDQQISDEDGTEDGACSESRCEAEKQCCVASEQPDRVSPKLANSLISRIELPEVDFKNVYVKPITETSSLAVETDERSKCTGKETIHNVLEHNENENKVTSCKETKMGVDITCKTSFETSSDCFLTSPNDEVVNQEKGRKVTPSGANQVSSIRSASKEEQATHHFEPGAASAAIAKAKPKANEKTEDKDLVVAAELEEDKICSQFSDDEAESITSFGDAIVVDRDVYAEGMPTKNFKQSTLAPLTNTVPTNDKALIKGNEKKKEARKKLKATEAVSLKQKSKKATTTIIKKCRTGDKNKKTEQKYVSKGSTLKEPPPDSGKTQKQVTLAKWFQPNKKSNSS